MRDQVLQALRDSDKPLRPGDIAKSLGAESAAVSKAVQELKKDGLIHSPKRCFYAPAP